MLIFLGYPSFFMLIFYFSIFLGYYSSYIKFIIYNNYVVGNHAFKPVFKKEEGNYTSPNMK